MHHGTAGDLLKSGGNAANPSWQSPDNTAGGTDGSIVPVTSNVVYDHVNSATAHGLVAATDPGGAALLHVMASVNGATAWSVQDIFDATNPAALAASAAPGTALVAAHRDHVHLDPVVSHAAAADPHTVYSKADGTRDFSGVVVGVTPTLSSHLATKEYVDLAVANLGFDYYFNDTASGVGSYYKMLDAPTGEAESTFTTGTLTNGDNQLIFGWITATVGALPFDTIHAGIVDFHIHAQKFSGTKPLTLYTTLVERKADTSEFVISTSETSSAITTKASIPLHGSLATDYELTAGSELVCKVYANVGATGNDIVAKVFAEGTTTAHVGVPVATETLSDVFVRKSLYDAYSILMATTDDTPTAITIAEQQVVGRITGGTIKGLSIAELLTLTSGATVANVHYSKMLSWIGV